MEDQKPPSLEEIVKRETSGVPTNRGITEYAEGFGQTREQFIQWLSSKHKILDIGSGGAAFAQEVALLQKSGDIPQHVNVFSLDISYATNVGLGNIDYATHIALDNSSAPITRENMNYARRMTKDGSVSASFLHLPYRDDEFDGVIASFSFGINAKNAEQMIGSYKEVYRVMNKQTGNGYVTIVDNHDALTLGSIGSDEKLVYTLSDIDFLHPQLKHTEIAGPEGKIPVDYLEIAPR